MHPNKKRRAAVADSARPSPIKFSLKKLKGAFAKSDTYPFLGTRYRALGGDRYGVPAGGTGVVAEPDGCAEGGAEVTPQPGLGRPQPPRVGLPERASDTGRLFAPSRVAGRRSHSGLACVTEMRYWMNSGLDAAWNARSAAVTPKYRPPDTWSVPAEDRN